MMKNLKKKRLKKKMTQKELAELVGVSKRSVIRWEMGHSNPLNAFVRRLKEVLK